MAATQTAEGEAFLKRLAALPKDPGAPLTDAIKPSLDDEANLRKLFATERTHKRLSDPYVGLVDVFGPNTDAIRTIRARNVKDDEDRIGKYVMALDDKTRRKDGELAMAPTMEDFKARWAIFSEGALSQLTDWTGVIVAGGSVLACLAPLPDRVVKQGSKRAIRKYYHSEAYPASDVDLFLYGMTPEQVRAHRSFRPRDVILMLRVRLKRSANSYLRLYATLCHGRSQLSGPRMLSQFTVSSRLHFLLL